MSRCPALPLNLALLFALCLALPVMSKAEDAAHALPQAPEIRERPDWMSYFSARHVKGALAVFDQANNVLYRANPEGCRTGFLPASTFKILNACIALDSGEAPDTDFALPWDGAKRRIPEWNRDHTLASAFKVSAVWFYQELARRIGQERMRAAVAKAGYGNRDIAGAPDSFWLDGALRISPEEQIDFLRRLHARSLPFSRRAQDLTLDLMRRDIDADATLYAKTGLAAQDKNTIGWFVGWLDNGHNRWFFAALVKSPQPGPDFPGARETVVRAALANLGVGY